MPWTSAVPATAACSSSWAPTTRWFPRPTPGPCLNGERIAYWLSVGAQPSDKVQVLIKKYGAGGTHLAAQKEAIDRLAQARRRPEPPPLMPRAPKPAPAAEEGDHARRGKGRHDRGRDRAPAAGATIGATIGASLRTAGARASQPAPRPASRPRRARQPRPRTPPAQANVAPEAQGGNEG